MAVATPASRPGFSRCGPRSRPGLSPRADEPGRRSQTEGIFMSVPAPGLGEHHLLVVDDDERLRTLLQRYLSSNGFRVTTAMSADDAQSLMRGIAFDLLIVDV